MKVRTSLVCILILAQVYLAHGDCDANSEPKSPSLRLKKKLLCNYEKESRPVKDKDKYLPVLVRIVPRYIEYNTYSTHTITVNSWMSLIWTDEYLTWKPEENDGVTRIHVGADEIWAPEIKLNNGVSDSDLMTDGECIVRPNGRVVCIIFSERDSMCQADLTMWPYDTQSCAVQYTTHMLRGERVDLKMNPVNPIVLQGYNTNAEWELLNVTGTRHLMQLGNETFAVLTYNYNIKRHAAADTVVVVIPSLVIGTLTLAVLWLPPGETERFYLAMVNIFIQLFSMEQISWTVPKNGDTIPRILIFWRDSLLLCTMILLETVIVKSIVASKRTPVSWLLTTTRYLNNGIMRKVLILEDVEVKHILKDEENTVELNESQIRVTDNKEEKYMTAIVLDRITFIGAFIAFLVMVFKLLI